MLSCFIMEQPHIAQLGNWTTLILPDCTMEQPHIVWLGNRTAPLRNQLCQFGVVHRDSWLHNGAPRHVTGTRIRNWRSWASM